MVCEGKERTLNEPVFDALGELVLFFLLLILLRSRYYEGCEKP
jgi:hypothetical protein